MHIIGFHTHLVTEKCHRGPIVNSYEAYCLVTSPGFVAISAA